MRTERLPTLDDVAVVAGVSRATVSRVVNNARNVDPDLHRTVMAAIAQVGYVPNRAARSLMTRKAGWISLVVSEAEDRPSEDPFKTRVFTDPFFGRVVAGLLSVLQPAHTGLSLNLVGSQAAGATLISSLRHGHLDGAVVISLHPHDPLPQLLAEARVPAVLFGRPAQPINLSYVDVATGDGARLAADHLVASGRTHIGTITGSLDMPAGAERLWAFQRAMRRHGVGDVPMAEGDFTQAGGERATTEFLAAHPEVDGLFVASDVMAHGVMHVLAGAGRVVPDSVAVVGFDDSSAAISTRPPLTTVRQPIEEMAAELGRILLGAGITDQRKTTSVIFEPTLVIRQSG